MLLRIWTPPFESALSPTSTTVPILSTGTFSLKTFELRQRLVHRRHEADSVEQAHRLETVWVAYTLARMRLELSVRAFLARLTWRVTWGDCASAFNGLISHTG